jgi:hypothetical protein
MLKNPFLIVRYACFSSMLFLNLLTLIFATLNVVANKAFGKPAPGASVLLLFNSALVFLAIIIAFAELTFSKVRTAVVKIECTWTGIVSILQLAGALTVTSLGPPYMCRPLGSQAACSSATVLVPVAWLSSFTVLVYFLTLTITTVVYAPSTPEIWSTSVYAVDWFAPSTTHSPYPSQHKRSLSNSSTTHSVNRAKGVWADDEEEAVNKSDPARSCLSLAVAPWARRFQNQRAVDRPFATRSLVAAANPDVPMPPPKSYPTPIAARYLEISRPFPSEVDDQDRPVPRPTLSQWVRADQAEGKTVHTRPPISPLW